MMRLTLPVAALVAAVALLAAPASTKPRPRSIGRTPTLVRDKYPMPPTFAQQPEGAKALNLLDEDVLLGAAWMEPTDSLEPDARLIFDDTESVDLFVAFLGSDSGGDVRVKLKLDGDTAVGETKDVSREYVVDDDVVLTRWWTYGVLPRGRYRLKIKVSDGTRWGRGEAAIHFEVLDIR